VPRSQLHLPTGFNLGRPARYRQGAETRGVATDERDLVWRTLDQYQENYGPLTVIQGGAPGADRWAREWAHQQTPAQEVALVNVPADWEKWGTAAGPKRNQMMLDQKPDIVLAFPGGRGTADMIARAEQAGVEVVTVGWKA
jgi:hypothetical protein